MNPRIYLIFFYLLAALSGSSQGVGIGTNNPDPSAKLDITSTTSGFLAPRMSTANRLAIPSPATGLMVYDNTLNQFMIYNGSAWTPLLSGLSGWTTTGNSSTSPATNFIGTIDKKDFVLRTFNTEWMRLDTNGALGIGQTAPDAKSILDIKSTGKGILLPRMTSGQRTSAPMIANGSTTDASRDGLTVYDTNLENTMQWNATLHQWDTVLNTTDANALYWKLLGNTGTDATVNFIGTVDNTDLVFKTLNIERMRLDVNGGIGMGQSSPDAKAILDIKSTVKGVLLPRMTSAQRTSSVNLIPNGSTADGSRDGLTVYDTNLENTMQWNATLHQWDTVLNTTDANALYWKLLGNTLTSPATNFIGTVDKKDFVLRTFNTEWMRLDTNGALGLGQTAPDTKSILDIKSTARGVLLPRMSSAQRLAIIANGSILDAARNGLMVYDTTIGNITQWNYYLHQWDTVVTTADGSGLYWKLLGNTGTSAPINSLVNYLGTTDSTDLVLGTNGRERFRIKANGLFYTANQGPGVSSIFMGGLAGAVNTGSYNSGYGLSSLAVNSTGSYNSAIGSFSLTSNTSGSNNTAAGFSALSKNTTGYYNTAIGDSALFNNTTGTGNVGVGEKSMKANTSAYGNTACGISTMYNNTLGSENVAMGDSAMAATLNAGQYNIGIGNKAMLKNTGSYNVAVGYEASQNGTSASQNVAIGYNASLANQTGDQNVAIGSGTLYSSTTGFNNVAIGTSTIENDIAPEYSIGIGTLVLYAGKNSYENIAIGHRSMFGFNGVSYGSDNVAIGVYTLTLLSSGTRNLALGANAGNIIEDGSSNVALGAGAMDGNVSGDGNIAIGDAAWSYGGFSDSNTIIGFHANTNGTNFTDATALGAGTVVDQDYSMRFGDIKVKRWGFGTDPSTGHALQVGTTTANGNGAYLTTGGVWTNTSDRNLKTSFETLDPHLVLDKINQLEVTRWEYIGTPVPEFHIGPMAQDFYRLFQVGVNDRSISTIDPAGVALIGVQALSKDMQQLHQSTDEKWQQVHDENSALKNEVEELKSRIERLEKLIDKK